MREGDEMKPKIIRSQIKKEGYVHIEWSDGLIFHYWFDLEENELGMTRLGDEHLPYWDWRIIRNREAVSRTSARETLNGCGVQKVSR